MILLDYKDRRSIYEQVEEKLQNLIVNGVLIQDSQLPSVRSLAMELSINPNTIQRAYAQLERKGFIYSVKGKGSFVAENSGILEMRRKDLLLELAAVVERAKIVKLEKKEFLLAVEEYYDKGEARV